MNCWMPHFSIHICMLKGVVKKRERDQLDRFARHFPSQTLESILAFHMTEVLQNQRTIISDFALDSQKCSYGFFHTLQIKWIFLSRSMRDFPAAFAFTSTHAMILMILGMPYWLFIFFCLTCLACICQDCRLTDGPLLARHSFQAET